MPCLGTLGLIWSSDYIFGKLFCKCQISIIVSSTVARASFSYEESKKNKVPLFCDVQRSIRSNHLLSSLLYAGTTEGLKIGGGVQIKVHLKGKVLLRTVGF